MAEIVGERPPPDIDVRRKLEKAERYGHSHLISIFPIDNADGTLDVIYMFQHNEEVVQYRYTIPADMELESLSDLYRGAWNMEREAVDLFGMRFKGVPPGLFLMPEGGIKAPLRKPIHPKTEPKDEEKKEGIPNV
jgi:NADH:ubiquinone oxidoreductase subunit C